MSSNYGSAKPTAKEKQEINKTLDVVDNQNSRSMKQSHPKK